jgi:hypothetical protein
MLEERIETPLIEPPRIILEELDGDEVVVRIEATPVVASDGPKLASEVLGVVGAQTRGGTGGFRDGRNGEGGREQTPVGAPRHDGEPSDDE